ncbi:hypothetical protein Daura_51380 [Dactylosporangium aurantiacum]|uniref:Uncharacterized protein n=1 Tax=Dactylosporangium aurantiacum TaxID=35754 RepID=A0A9Q9IKH4_9ACTN|nr:hypothetical protein [Dactylosporangium aurantiacum]MDG6101266.1 hypothetical protein [Dactylosporangium aurantiacum]UWZ54718.1 hypothetical protein Daura_51380 [Dactylosporangium aurantiacum]
MTTFSDADFDLLADFVGGALDGTPAADDVRRLISTDQGWAEAYGALVTAEVAVRDQLTELGAAPVPVPADVEQRLNAALQAAVLAPASGAPVLDLARAREARRRRTQRWVIGLATAAAVLVCGGLGIRVAIDQQSANLDTATSASDGGKGEAAPQQLPPTSGGTRTSTRSDAALVASGQDYGPGTVGQLAQASPPAPAIAGEGSGSADLSKSSKPNAVPEQLRRLQDPVARAACLNAVVGEYGGQVALVDYARFEGRPALVVIVDGTRLGAGKRLVLAVGPDCGIGGAIADELYRGIA